MWALISTPTLATRETIHKSDRYEIITVGGRQAERHTKRKQIKIKERI